MRRALLHAPAEESQAGAHFTAALGRHLVLVRCSDAFEAEATCLEALQRFEALTSSHYQRFSTEAVTVAICKLEEEGFLKAYTYQGFWEDARDMWMNMCVVADYFGGSGSQADARKAVDLIRFHAPDLLPSEDRWPAFVQQVAKNSRDLSVWSDHLAATWVELDSQWRSREERHLGSGLRSPQKSHAPGGLGAGSPICAEVEFLEAELAVKRREAREAERRVCQAQALVDRGVAQADAVQAQKKEEREWQLQVLQLQQQQRRPLSHGMPTTAAATNSARRQSWTADADPVGVYSTIVPASCEGIHGYGVAENRCQPRTAPAAPSQPVCYSGAGGFHRPVAHWEEAVQVLKDMRAQWQDPDLKTYRAAIYACRQDGEGEAAFRVLQMMKERRMSPTAAMVAAAIAAWDRGGQPERALPLFQEKVDEGVLPDVAMYSVTVSACQHAGQLAEALQLWSEMRAKKLVPSVLACNAILEVHASLRQPMKAMDVWEEMRQTRLDPDRQSYDAIISALSHLSSGRRADSDMERYARVARDTTGSGSMRPPSTSLLDIFEDMRSHGFVPSELALAAAAREHHRQGNIAAEASLMEELKIRQSHRSCCDG